MALNLDFINDETISSIIEKSAAGAAIKKLANVEVVSGKGNVKTVNIKDLNVKFHTTGEKQESGSVSELQINIGSLYSVQYFDDYADVTGSEIYNVLFEKLPREYEKALDRQIFGPIGDTSRFEGFTESAVVVDDTAASWEAAIETVEDNGYNPTGMILHKKLRSKLTKALTEGSQVNPLTVNIVDGYEVNGIPVYFRDLGEEIGVIGDFDQSVLALGDTLEFNTYYADNDAKLAILNKDMLKTSLRAGFGVFDQKAFVPLTTDGI